MSLINILLLLVITEICIFTFYVFRQIKMHFLSFEKDLIKRYGKDTWVLITGATGQATDFAIEFAKRGFNILLIGSKRTVQVKENLTQEYGVNVENIIVDFSSSFNKKFFAPIRKKIQDLDIGILVNNIGHRVAWRPYHNMPEAEIMNTIACGTLPIAKLTHMLIPHFLERKKKGKKSLLINLNATCIHHTFGLGRILNNEISIPYLSVYEGTNVFGHFFSMSIYKEYCRDFDILNVMPGAVVTENTLFLRDTIFSIPSSIFVQNIIRLIGNAEGKIYGYWGHALAPALVNIFPFVKNSILYKTGVTLADYYMRSYSKIYKHRYVLS